MIVKLNDNFFLYQFYSMRYSTFFEPKINPNTSLLEIVFHASAAIVILIYLLASEKAKLLFFIAFIGSKTSSLVSKLDNRP